MKINRYHSASVVVLKCAVNLPVPLNNGSMNKINVTDQIVSVSLRLVSYLDQCEHYVIII